MGCKHNQLESSSLPVWVFHANALTMVSYSIHGQSSYVWMHLFEYSVQANMQAYTSTCAMQSCQCGGSLRFTPIRGNFHVTKHQHINYFCNKKKPLVMKLAINGSYKLWTELDTVYEQGLAQYHALMKNVTIWLPGHRTHCYKGVIGFISNHLPNGVESSCEGSGGLGTATRKGNRQQ